jgi:hypothetical protein
VALHPLFSVCADGINQLYPGLSVQECSLWLEWVYTQPDYYVSTIGQSTCITKVYDQVDPPWLRVAQEVAWWGHGRDAVRVLRRGMDWARLQGAVMYGYSLAPHYDILRWRKL